MTEKKWTKLFILGMAVFVLLAGLTVGIIDPFFHYHAPLPGFYYVLDDQRSQNDGITRNFEYNAILLGTSHIEQFRSSYADELFGVDSVKLPYPGATLREMNEDLLRAFDTHDDIRLVIRTVDQSYLLDGKDAMHLEMGEYPTWLYNRNPFDDIRYWLNRDVLFKYCARTVLRRLSGVQPGHTSFDDYSAVDASYFSKKNAVGDRWSFDPAPEQMPSLTDEERESIRENVRQNINAVAGEHPETQFICFVPPESILRWGARAESGELMRQLEANEIAVQTMLECDNIRVFNFTAQPEIILDLDNYKDNVHYSTEIADRLLLYMSRGECEVTGDNAEAVSEAVRTYFSEFDYNSVLK